MLFCVLWLASLKLYNINILKLEKFSKSFYVKAKICRVYVLNKPYKMEANTALYYLG